MGPPREEAPFWLLGNNSYFCCCFPRKKGTTQPNSSGWKASQKGDIFHMGWGKMEVLRTKMLPWIRASSKEAR